MPAIVATGMTTRDGVHTVITRQVQYIVISDPVSIRHEEPKAEFESLTDLLENMYELMDKQFTVQYSKLDDLANRLGRDAGDAEAAAALAAAGLKKAEDEAEAAAKRKAVEEAAAASIAAAKKKAEQEAAAAKNSAEEQARAVAKKKAEKEAAAAKEKNEDVAMAVAKKKAEQEAAAAKNNAEKVAIAAANKKAHEEAAKKRNDQMALMGEIVDAAARTHTCLKCQKKFKNSEQLVRHFNVC